MPRARPPSSRRTSERDAAALAELEALYLQVDAAYVGWSCPSSTECCRFGVTGREPYVTSIELYALRRAVAARGGMASLRKPSPLRDGKGRQDRPRRSLALAPSDERPCPLLTESGRCAVYAARPLGCRTFHCSRATAGDRVDHARVGAFVRAIQTIAERQEPGGERGRPLSRAF